MTVELKMLPNCITVMRILGTVALLFTKPLTCWFYVIYVLTGATDVLDGFIARKFNITSEFGAKLDSVADLLFYAVMFAMIMPYLWTILPTSMWYCVSIILLLRLSAYSTAAIRFHKFAASHSLLNKITGALVFAIPFFLLFPFTVPIFWVICFVSGLASLLEFIQYLFTKKTSI